MDITVAVSEPTTTVMLHSRELNIVEVTYTPDGGQAVAPVVRRGFD
jgi:hypothetical protein